MKQLTVVFIVNRIYGEVTLPWCVINPVNDIEILRIMTVHGVSSGFHRDVIESCALLGYYTAWSGNSVPTFRDNLSVSSSIVKTLEAGTGRLFRNIGTDLPLYAA
jgi:hypothetical protein